MTDQLGSDCLVYTAGSADTPNIDRPVAEGMVSDYAFANCPICAQARIYVRLPEDLRIRLR